MTSKVQSNNEIHAFSLLKLADILLTLKCIIEKLDQP